MKKMRKAPFIFSIAIVFVIGLAAFVFLIPYFQADKQQSYEEELIDQYLKDTKIPDAPLPDQPGGGLAEEGQGQENADTGSQGYDYSDVGSNGFVGSIDSILVIDKINMKKAIIRSNDNDYNLDRYYFVTADTQTPLGEGNYIIYGHCSQTFGHSFNRLDEMEIGDTFYMVQNGREYSYQIEAKDKVLRSECASFFPDKVCVTLVSCERYLQPGFSEKRVIIIRAVPA